MQLPEFGLAAASKINPVPCPEFSGPSYGIILLRDQM